MKYTTEIHKNNLYVKPRPKENIADGLVMLLNQPISAGKEPFMFTDLIKNRKKYDMPHLPDGVWVVGALVKNGEKKI